jgi:hypothetical protein
VRVQSQPAYKLPPRLPPSLSFSLSLFLSLSLSLSLSLFLSLSSSPLPPLLLSPRFGKLIHKQHVGEGETQTPGYLVMSVALPTPVGPEMTSGCDENDNPVMMQSAAGCRKSHPSSPKVRGGVLSRGLCTHRGMCRFACLVDVGRELLDHRGEPINPDGDSDPSVALSAPCMCDVKGTVVTNWRANAISCLGGWRYWAGIGRENAPCHDIQSPPQHLNVHLPPVHLLHLLGRCRQRPAGTCHSITRLDSLPNSGGDTWVANPLSQITRQTPHLLALI